MITEDIHKAINDIPRLWVRGNFLVLATILIEISRKTLWYTGFFSHDIMNNAFIGSSLFLGMLAGLDLLRVYVYISWISDLAFELSLLAYSQDSSSELPNSLNRVGFISVRNLMEGILLTSISFLLWISVPIGISKLNRSLMKLGIDERLGRLSCYLGLILGCKTDLRNILSILEKRLESIISILLETPLG
ncbi:MAG: hypothetical protein F7B59_00750 [Desulfurococcales archaeon]|nr:hypothetical protein [Desulfurococcales archaeon]